MTKLRIWSHLLKKSLIKNFIFCAVWKENIDLKWVNKEEWDIFIMKFLPGIKYVQS